VHVWWQLPVWFFVAYHEQQCETASDFELPPVLHCDLGLQLQCAEIGKKLCIIAIS